MTDFAGERIDFAGVEAEVGRVLGEVVLRGKVGGLSGRSGEFGGEEEVGGIRGEEERRGPEHRFFESLFCFFKLAGSSEAEDGL